MDFLENHVEALIFCSSTPINIQDIKACLVEMFDTDIPDADIGTAINSIKDKYVPDKYPFQVYEEANGFQFLTKPAYQASVSILLKQKSKKRLSTSALETLSIIAYKQPITKGEIEQIRGVNCDYAVQKLLEKELIEIKGKSESIGRPLLYGTSNSFMEYFGINNIKDLPTPKEFNPEEENMIGNQDAEE